MYLMHLECEVIYTKSMDIKHLFATDSDAETVQSVDWYIMPVLNPDGYEFSQNYDRMWRKTRSKYTDNGDSIFSMALV